MRRCWLIGLLILAGSGQAAERLDEAPPLMQGAAEPDEGRRVFTDREAGHCVLCHKVDELKVPFQGNLGPDLSGIGTRLSSGQIRLRIMDASILNPATIMPPYYRTRGLHRVGHTFAGKTALSARQIEQLVAWLSSLEAE